MQIYELVLEKDTQDEIKILLSAQQGSFNSTCRVIHEAQQTPGESGVFGHLTSSVAGVVCVWIQVCSSFLSLFYGYITLNKVKDR